jgi:hypothetical protein
MSTSALRTTLNISMRVESKVWSTSLSPGGKLKIDLLKRTYVLDVIVFHFIPSLLIP